MRKPLTVAGAFACAIALAFVACDDPLEDLSERGGWDGNSGNYNGNIGSFGTVAGVGGVPAWALEATGPGTVNNGTMYGIQWAPTQTTTPCVTATPGIVAVRFLSSSGSGAAAVGPDLEVERTGGGRTRLTLGETIVFPGRVFDGYLSSVEVMFRARRVDTLIYRNVPWYQWPVFSLELCENVPLAQPPPTMPVWKHLGFVSWAPFVRLPELDGEALEFRTDLVQAITTIPRLEYRNNPNVPPVVANQSGSLLFKFAFFSGTPIALNRESALELRTSVGNTVSNAEYQFRGAMALGNASWVTLPPDEDPQQHRFLSFFTRDGTEVALFSLARGNGITEGAIHLPTAWGGGVVPALELTADELTAEAAQSLDNVQAVMQTAPLPAGQRIAAAPTHVSSGRSTFRIALYLNSTNNRKYWFYSRYRGNVLATSLGAIVGPVQSQSALANEMRATLGPAIALVAAQSPLPPGTQPFEQSTNVEPPPPGAPVIPPNPPIDAPIDAPPIDAVDAPPIDAADAPPIDATDAPTDAPDAGVDAPVDAPTDAADAAVDAPTDAPDDAPIMMPDAPTDAPSDAPIMMPDAPTDAPSDAPIMMPDAVAADAPSDAPIMMPDAPADAPSDAPIMMPDAPADAPADAPISIDAGLDALIDAPLLIDAGLDALIVIDAAELDAPEIDAEIDAPADAPTDAEIDAPDAPVDAPIEGVGDAPIT